MNIRKLSNYILEQEVKHIYSEYFKTHKYEDWLYGVYDGSVDEVQYYWNKFTVDLGDTIPNYYAWQELLYERLQDSFKLTGKNIQQIQNFPGVVNFELINHKKYKFKIHTSKEFNSNEFDSIMNFYGYTCDRVNKNERQYEAVIPEEIKEKFDYVYHVTTHSGYEKIKKLGLIPKQKPIYNKLWKETDKKTLEYPYRIYVWKPDTDIIDMKMFAHLRNKVKGANINDVVILKIEVPSHIKFYGDPAFSSTNAMFTMEPIQSQYIEGVIYEE